MQPVLVRLDWRPVHEMLGDLKDDRQTLRAIAMGMRAGSVVLQTFVIQNLSGRLIKVRTGNLRHASFVDAPRIEGRTVYVLYGASSRAQYSRIHEFGGVIRHPGGTPFFFKNGEIIYVRKETGLRLGLPVTKPHLIRIKERRMYRDAGERSGDAMVQQVGLSLVNLMVKGI